MLLVVGGLLLLVALFMFGQAVYETAAAVVRIAFSTLVSIFRFIGNSMLALGWYITGVLLVITVAGGLVAYVYWFKPGGLELGSTRPPLCTELMDRKGKVLDYLCPF